MSVTKVRRNWRKIQPTSLRHAMDLCLQYAKEQKNLSVERISDRMSLTSHYTLYKWIADAKMPSNYIQAYEHVCGIDYITQYLAFAGHKLIIPIPSGSKATDLELNQMQSVTTEAIRCLIDFYSGEEDAEKTLAKINSAMCGFAFHRENIEKNLHPELALFEDEQ